MSVEKIVHVWERRDGKYLVGETHEGAGWAQVLQDHSTARRYVEKHFAGYKVIEAVPLHVSRKDVDRAVCQYFRNNAMHELTGDPQRSWIGWLRDEMGQAIIRAFKGGNAENIITRTVRTEVGAVLNRWSKEGALKVKIEEIIREEVRAVIKSKLKIEASMAVDVNPERYNGEALF